MSIRLCAVIPSRNHYEALEKIVRTLRAHGLSVIIVDDGSNAPAKEHIARLATIDEEINILRLPVNRGKGAAVMEGVRSAAAKGFTHVVQIDADGQHDLEALPALIEAGK